MDHRLQCGRLWYRNRERDWNETHYSPIGEEEKELLVTTFTRNTHNLYAAKLVFTHPMAGGTLSFGGEYSHSKRTNLYTNPQGILADDDSYSKEGIASGFVEYGRKIGRVNLQAGVRFEHVAFDYYIKNIRRDDMSRTSDDFFPSLALSFPLGKMQMQLGYAKDIQRPAFKQLSGEINYSNRYTYQTGNPLLRPTMTDNITLNAIYRWASLSVGYQHIKDKMLYTTEVYSEDTPDAILLSQGNYPSYDRCYASLTLTPKAGLWSPQLSGQFTKQWMELVTPNGAVRANEPIFSIVWRNGFKLPAGFIVNANAYWQGKGYRENTYIAKNIWKMDFSIQKSFFKERLSVHLNATNAFRTYRGRTCMTTDLQTWTQRYNNSQYAYTMNIRYKFNTTKSKYKGTGAGASQKSRM